jgi:hypothetical protein
MTDRRVIAHVLRRMTFGPTTAEVDAAVRAGLEPTVDRLFAPTTAVRLPDLGPDPVAALTKGASRDEKLAARQKAQDQVAQATWWWVSDQGDLKFTTDFRDVYATLLQDVLGGDPGKVLNGWSGSPEKIWT